jgi:putative inorganic carbon (HCO3(-)) transporter
VASLILSLPSYLRRITLVISALLVVGLLVIVISNPAPFLNLLVGRTELWSRALYALQDFPFTGLGMNTFRSIVPRLYPLFLVGPQPDIGHAHNEFLQAGLDLGLPGLIAFVALYLGAFWMLVKVWRAESLDTLLFYHATALGLGGGLLAHLIYGLTDAVALGAKPGLLFWMLLGLISGLHRQTATFVPQST